MTRQARSISRIGKGGDPELPGLRGRFRPGGVECLGGPSEILLLSTGGLAVEAAAAARSLEAAGVACTLGVAATLAPVEESELARLFAGLRWIFTLEEHYRTGGLGSLVADVLSATAGPARLHRFGVPADLDRASGSPACLRARAGLDAATVSHRILELLGRSPT